MNAFKYILLAVLAIGLAACGSNQPKEEVVEESTEVIEPEVVATPADDEDVSASQYDNGLAAGVDTVFYFGYDKSDLSSSAQAALDAHAAALRATGRSIRIEGHADERGTREYNLALGERRAKKVADYLAFQGVSRSLMEVVSYGEEKPVASASNESAYAQNRRVELR